MKIYRRLLPKIIVGLWMQEEIGLIYLESREKDTENIIFNKFLLNYINLE